MYESHFGLADSPFRIAPDLRFFVETAPHRVAVRALRDGFAQGDEFMLLTGDFGAGKSIVARRLFEDLPRGQDRVGWLSSQCVEGDDLFERIAETFAVPQFETRHPLGAMTRVLEGYGREGRQALLFIDEAHRLDVHSLRRLRKLTSVRTGRRGILHVVLIGRHPPPGIAELDKIRRPLEIGRHITLGALDEDGTRDYVLGRLEHAGWSGRPSFDDEAIAEIHARCAGNPGRINRLGSHVLLQLYMKNLEEVTAGYVRAVDELMASELEQDPGVTPLEPGFPAATRSSVDAALEAEPTASSVAPPAVAAVKTAFDPESALLPTSSGAIHGSGAQSATSVPEISAPTEAAGMRGNAIPATAIDGLRFGPETAALPELKADAAEIAARRQPPTIGSRAWLKNGLAAVVICLGGGMAWHAVAHWITPSTSDALVHKTP